MSYIGAKLFVPIGQVSFACLPVPEIYTAGENPDWKTLILQICPCGFKKIYWRVSADTTLSERRRYWDWFLFLRFILAAIMLIAGIFNRYFFETAPGKLTGNIINRTRNGSVHLDSASI